MAKENANKNSSEKSEIKKLKSKLLTERKNIGKNPATNQPEQVEQAEKFCVGYKRFLDNGKTERAACKSAVEMAREAGFIEYKPGEKYSPGAKVYFVNRSRAVIFAVIGSEPFQNGMNIIASHIDSPRIDLKQNPLFEEGELAYFKTHYYGGIKKYQWPSLPLALHGVVIKEDGTSVDVEIGEDDNDPVFTVTDLLPHLSDAQYKRPANELIRGEELNLLIGSRPFVSGEESDSVKLAIMKLLNNKYGIVERDFATAELEAVPAFKARDIGFDRSIVGGYGQDDRSCAYTSLAAILELATPPKRTALCVLADKEEVGSQGNTGLASRFLEYFIADLVGDSYEMRRCLANSKCLSADVCAAFDPTFPDVFEKNNTPFMNHGTVIVKYVGSRGKSGTNDASAEFVGEIRRIFDSAGVVWQTGELGKVDAGGGGTVAMFISKLNVDTIDVGVPVLSMHAPMELTAKSDLYMTYKGFKAFYSA
ncbi:MAG: aminopeptidase [Oscillospiraceae bacterium]|nr:aminopeptidase [Oscillospiraceae bacterium]